MDIIDFFLDNFSIYCIHAPNKASSVISAYFEEYRFTKMINAIPNQTIYYLRMQKV